MIGLAVYLALLAAALARLLARRARRPDAGGHRRRLRRRRRAHVALRGVPGGSRDVDAARRRRGAGARSRAAAGRRRQRTRSDPSRPDSTPSRSIRSHAGRRSVAVAEVEREVGVRRGARTSAHSSASGWRSISAARERELALVEHGERARVAGQPEPLDLAPRDGARRTPRESGDRAAGRRRPRRARPSSCSTGSRCGEASSVTRQEDAAGAAGCRRVEPRRIAGTGVTGAGRG